MSFERTGDVERGLRVIPRLGEVMPDEAGEEVRAVYERTRSHLRVPIVNFLFRSLANYPPYLSFAWDRVEPHLLTPRFEEAADALRSRSLVEPISDYTDWSSLGDLSQIRAFTDTIHYVLPKLLLVSNAFDEGLGGETGVADGPEEAGVRPGVAEGATSVAPVGPNEADEETEEVFEEIREHHGHPDVASYYRGIARWPEFLKFAWKRIGPLIGTPAYEERKRDLLEVARASALELSLPGRGEVIERDLGEEQVEELRAILAVFRFRLNPDTLLDVSLIKALLDGPEAARSSRFSFARQKP
ncbi:MAG: halocarboxylic acid dehydrogenase DehI family protein [Actinomycetota bacterium]|nr:halocarboxylic acid dehydrogenase DehI family protein [Actinomycetota bacterium]